jgi:phage-related protein
MADLTELVWVGSSKKELKEFPGEVVDDIGFALETVQRGQKPVDSKVLQGFGGAGVLEIVADFHTDTFRAVYTVKFAGRIYVLHCFQKKSTHGRKTPKQHLDQIERRLKLAKEIHEEWQRSQEKS